MSILEKIAGIIFVLVLLVVGFVSCCILAIALRNVPDDELNEFVKHAHGGVDIAAEL